MRKHALPGILTAVAVLALGVTLVGAEDIKGKFYVGGDLGVLVTTDNIRSNAALIIAPLGNDGAPFTGDRGEIISCDTIRPDVFCDPRPDDLIARNGNLEQTIAYTLRAGYGLTSNLAIQLDVGYYKGELRNIDVYTEKNVPLGGNPTDPCVQAGKDPCLLTFLRTREIKSPFTAGEVKEMPITLSALYRFRTDSNFNPYLGIGAGWLTTDAKETQAVADLNARFESLHLRTVTDKFGTNFGTVFASDGDGNAPFTFPGKLEINDGFIWHVSGGGEYFFNDRLSLSVDVKYTLANHEVSFLFGGVDQINMEAWTEDMFRKDGTLKVFLNGNSLPPNPRDPNSPGMAFRFDCDVDNDGDIIDDLGKDYDGSDANRPPNMRRADACYRPAPGNSGSTTEKIVVQGGSIRLTNFNVAMGLRFHF